MEEPRTAIQRRARDFFDEAKRGRRNKLTGQAYLDYKPLNERQQKYVHNVVQLGLSSRAAALAVGATEKNVNVFSERLRNNPGVLYAIELERQRFERASMMTKKKVMDGFLEAIEMAKLQAEPMVMVAGWREVARMCGYFEPTRHKLEVTVQGEVVIQKLQQLDDHQLLQLADGDLNALEGEFQLVGKA